MYHLVAVFLGVVLASPFLLDYNYAFNPEDGPSFGAAPRVLTVSQGGTGAASFIEGECLIGHGTGPLTSQACGGASSSFSTTSADYWKDQRNFFSTTSADYYVHSSTTIPKTYTANTFTSLQTFRSASTTILSVLGPAYFGATATSTFGTDGGLSIGDGVKLIDYSVASTMEFQEIGGTSEILRLGFENNGLNWTTGSGITVANWNGMQLRGEQGGANTSGFGFVTDGNTGLFSSSADTLQLLTGGNTRLSIDSVGLVTATNASTTLLSTSYASSTLYYGAGLANCNTENMLTWTDGRFGCESDTAGAGGTGSNWQFTAAQDAITPTTTVGVILNASSTFSGPLSILNTTVSTSTVVSKQAAGSEYTTIQSAIAALWRPIFVKGGTFAEQISILSAKTKLIGESLLATIQATGATQSPALSATTTDETYIEGVTITEANASDNGIAVDFSNTAVSRLLFSRINNFATSTQQRDTTSNTFYNLLLGNLFFNCGSACVELSGTQANANTSAFNRARPMQTANGGFGHYLVDARGFTSLADDIEGTSTSNGVTGVYIATTSREISYVNPWIEANQTGVNIDTGARRINFFGGSITSNGTDVINNGTDVCFWNVSITGVTKNECNGNFSILSPGIFFASSTVMDNFRTTYGTTTYASTTALSVSGLTASRAIFTDANSGLTTTGTVGNLESSVGSQNILLETEIDGCSEIAALWDNETGGCNGTSGPVLPDNATFSGTTTIVNLDVTTALDIFNNYYTTFAAFANGLVAAVTNAVLTGTWDFSGATVKQHTYSSFSYATSTAWTGTTTIPLGPAYTAESWSGVKCFTDAGTLNVSFNDGTNRMNLFNASTTVGTVGLVTNNTFTASEKRYVDIGTPASSPTKVSCTLDKIVNN